MKKSPPQQEQSAPIILQIPPLHDTQMCRVLRAVFGAKPTPAKKFFLGPGIMGPLRAGDHAPFCHHLELLGPGPLANEDVQALLYDLWRRVPDDKKARKVFLDIGKALARVSAKEGRPPTRTEAERQHAPNISRSLRVWVKKFETYIRTLDARDAANRVLQEFDDRESIKNQERKALVHQVLSKELQARIKQAKG